MSGLAKSWGAFLDDMVGVVLGYLQVQYDTLFQVTPWLVL